MILSRNYEAFFNQKFMKLNSIHHSEYYKYIGFCHLKPKNILIYKIDLHLIFSHSLVELILVGNFEKSCTRAIITRGLYIFLYIFKKNFELSLSEKKAQ